jgi:hypothetical protein
MRFALAALAATMLLPATSRAELPADVSVRDSRNDAGRSLTISWTPGVDDAVMLDVERVAVDGSAELVGQAFPSDGEFVDGPTAQGNEGPPDGVPVKYRLTLRDPDGPGPFVITNEAIASPQYFHTDRFNVLLILSMLFAFVMINVARAQRGGGSFYIRKLAAVDAMEEAIGRATEMGRPVLYVPGIEEVEDIQTIASMLILERIAEKTARYDVQLEVPTRTPFVLAVADEVVRTGCSAAGRPDAYRPDAVRYISSEQFAYCAGVNGIILREKPAANFYLGRFFAESLIFAETGFAAGSIQIAGTAEVTQLPFFIAACDYTLIGEEFFAASAYLSQDPALLSTLKAADWAKVLLVSSLVIGAVLESLGHSWFREWFLVR